MRIMGVVSYKGFNYSGWQRQKNDPSIQGEIEKVLSQILNQPINIVGSGRTDAKVSALKQYFHFDVDKEVDLNRLLYSSNCLLPSDIYIQNLSEVDQNFHARYDVKKKIYTYYLYLGHRNPFLDQHMTNIKEDMSIDLFKNALLSFVGQHNFQNFTSKEVDENNFIREIYDINFVMPEKNIVKITFIGNGFMRYQIRNMVGTSIQVGLNKIPLSYIKDLLDNDMRIITPYKCDGVGLYLTDVIY